jgi:hypothetical protein
MMHNARSTLVAHGFFNHRRFLYCVDIIHNVISSIYCYVILTDNSGLPNSTTLFVIWLFAFSAQNNNVAELGKPV